MYNNAFPKRCRRVIIPLPGLLTEYCAMTIKAIHDRSASYTFKKILIEDTKSKSYVNTAYLVLYIDTGVTVSAINLWKR